MLPLAQRGCCFVGNVFRNKERKTEGRKERGGGGGGGGRKERKKRKICRATAEPPTLESSSDVIAMQLNTPVP